MAQQHNTGTEIDAEVRGLQLPANHVVIKRLVLIADVETELRSSSKIYSRKTAQTDVVTQVDRNIDGFLFDYLPADDFIVIAINIVKFGLALVVKNRRIKTETEQEPQPIGIDIEYELESVKTVEIDYRYLLSLIQSHMPTDSDTIGTITDAEDQRISSYIEQFSKDNPQIGQILRQVWLELKFNPESYRNKDAFTIVQERVREVVDKTVADFAAKWGINAEELKAFAVNTPATEVDPAKINAAMGDFKAYNQ